MSVDWSKYPPLPKPPKLPEWRDTPEHEAYWEEVEEIRTPLQTKWGCGGLFALWVLSAKIFNHWLWGNWDDISARIITGCTIGLFIAFVLWVICHMIFYWIAKHKISQRYGFSMRKLNRPDISKEIGDVLAERPDFNEADFCKYWQDEDQARAATSVLVSTRNYWCLHKKMLYPNDPLLLLFYGRRWRIFCQWRWGVGKEKMIEPDIEFYLDCVWRYLDGFDSDRFYEESKIFYSKSTTFAEFLEICEEMKAKEEMSQCSAGKKN